MCFGIPEDKPRAVNKPAQAAAPRSYHSPFPGQSSALHDETDYHVHQSTHTAKLVCTKQEKKERFEQEKLLMNLDVVTLVLWPVQGSKGWDVYSKLAKERERPSCRRWASE